MTAKLWNEVPSPMFDENGMLAGGALAYFYSAGTFSPLAIYTDSNLTTPGTNPAVANGNGVFAPIYLPYIDYKVIVQTATGGSIFEADGIANPAPPVAGGGGGIVVSQEQVFNTGDLKWTMTSAILTGFVRMNLRTIGSAASGATERANADTSALFTYLWNNCVDAEAPVSSGRGASAAADFAANKTIGIPTMQGRDQRGTDDMGGTAAGVIQAITTCTTNGTNVVVVVSNANMAIGMNAIVNGVGGRTITAISGANVTLSSVVAGVAAGISFRASTFLDAQAVQGRAGIFAFQLSANELPVHTHTITDPGHTHTEEGVTGSGTVTLGAGVSFPVSAANITGSSVTGITGTNSSGLGIHMPIMTPSRLGTFHIKL